MIDERTYELLYCQLGLANEEKAGLRKQVNALIARLKAIEGSNKTNSKSLVDTINNLKKSLEKQSGTVEHYRKEMELMRKQLEAKDEVNMMLANEISNLGFQLEDSRKYRFSRTSEQRRLLNNLNLDKSAMEKSEYDGSNKDNDDNHKADGNEASSNTASDSTCTDVWEYRFIKHVRSHNVEHVYKVARVKLQIALSHFSMPENRQIRLLARESIHISNTTLNCYIHNGITRLREFIESVFKEFVQQAKYLMIDKRPNLSEWKQKRASLTGVSTYGCSLQNISRWAIITIITEAGRPMQQNHSWNILWEPYPLRDIRFTGCLMKKTQRCFI